MNESLISAEWLYKNHKNPDLVILDCSTKPITSTQTFKTEQQIPNARFFDLKNKFRDTASQFPNTFPSQEQFVKEAITLGINTTSKIVIYDTIGVYTSPRVWWLFKTMGHKDVAILNGGFPEWIKHNYPTENKCIKTYDFGNFKANFKPENIKAYEFVKSNLKSKEALVIDARSQGRFNGIEPEPRKELQSGSIPSSINIPYTEVLENGKFKTPEELQAIFKDLEENNQDLVFTCGSGITACITLFASNLVLKNKKAIYDGSWTEWATKEYLYV